MFLLFPEEIFCWLYLDDVCRDTHMRRNDQHTPELRINGGEKLTSFLVMFCVSTH